MFGWPRMPNGEISQPTTRTFAQPSLDQIIGEISTETRETVSA
jgi:hypothetical protein